MSTKLPYLDWNYQPLMDSFRAFKARIGLYFEDNNITDDAKQSIKLNYNNYNIVRHIVFISESTL